MVQHIFFIYDITKYIYELSGAGIIVQRKIGTAKLCFLAKYVKKREK